MRISSEPVESGDVTSKHFLAGRWVGGHEGLLPMFLTRFPRVWTVEVWLYSGSLAVLMKKHAGMFKDGMSQIRGDIDVTVPRDGVYSLP